MNVIVDVQGFKTDDNQFIIKEIAIFNNNQVQVLLIKPPFPFYDLSITERRQVGWIERMGIHWKKGFIPYSLHKHYFSEIISNKRIITKGLQKVQWIKQLFGNVDILNLEDKGCPSLYDLYNSNKNSECISCLGHNKICALKNVIIFKKWCNENKCF